MIRNKDKKIEKNLNKQKFKLKKIQKEDKMDKIWRELQEKKQRKIETNNKKKGLEEEEEWEEKSQIRA